MGPGLSSSCYIDPVLDFGFQLRRSIMLVGKMTWEVSSSFERKRYLILSLTNKDKSIAGEAKEENCETGARGHYLLFYLPCHLWQAKPGLR